jgi:hypothetical protein
VPGRSAAALDPVARNAGPETEADGGDECQRDREANHQVGIDIATAEPINNP